MDQLIWSVEPKSTSAERRQLAAMIPGLIRKLAAGLKTAGIEDEVRNQFFGDLMKYHTQAISAPVAGKTDAASAAGQPPGSAADGQTAATGLPEFSPTISVMNPFGSGEISVDSLDFTPVAGDGARAERDADGADVPDGLTMGVWVEFREAEDAVARRPVRLIFVSPRRTRYLFAVDRVGKEIIECTRAEISRRFRLGEAHIVDEPSDESLFDRIMSGLVGKLRAPAAPH
jgi:hypothetical protein